MSKLISAEGGRKFWPLGGVINPRQQGGVRGGRLEFPKSPIFSGILLFRALPRAGFSEEFPAVWK